MKIAVAGNIASGKSAVQKFLEKAGFKVLDTDKCGHAALQLSQVKNALEDLDIFENNEISREKLGKLVFQNPQIKQKLESLVHPIIRANISDFFEENKNENLIFVAIPLIFEAKMEDMFDKIIFIYADDSIRLQRLQKRNNYDEAYAKKRLNAQLSQDEKILRCDYVIYNNGTLEELNTKVTELIRELS